MLNDLLKVAENAAQAAAKYILAEDLSLIQKKGRTDLVTNIDTASEKIICDILIKETPEFGILAEERSKTNLDAEYIWVIDPLDGTTNFVHGYPSYGVSVGCMQNNKPVLGVVMDLPAVNLYSAVKGNGAYCNEEKISVSDTDSIENGLFVTGFGYDHDEAWEANMNLFKMFTDQSQGVRRLGAASVDLCHVASGKVDGFWEFDLHPWDTAAGFVIVREAGGMVTQMDQSSFSIFDKNILVSNRIMHDAMAVQMSPVLDNLRKSGVNV